MTILSEDEWRWANAQDERSIAAYSKKQVTDKLDEIYEMQYALDQRIIDDRKIDKTLDEWVMGLTTAMESEIDEIRREVNWKWWKNTKPIDHDALRGEVIDLWHFLVSLSQKVGLTPEEVYSVYCEKNAENHARQEGKSDKEGYGFKDGTDYTSECISEAYR